MPIGLRAALAAILSLLVLTGCSSDDQTISQTESDPAAPEADSPQGVASMLQKICNDVLQDAQGELSDRAFETLLEEAGLGPTNPSISATEQSVLLTDIGICLEDIEQHLTDEYGITAATIERMKSTRALDGEKSAQTNDWTVYWTYHPDSGLDIILERT